MINKLHMAMIELYHGDAKRIQHFCKVHSYAKLIAEMENVDAMMNSEIGFGRKVLQVFEDNGISFEHMPSGIDTMTVIVHQDEFVEKEQKVLAELHRAVNPDSIELESNLALIAVVGRGMKNSVGNAANVISALSNAKINVKMIDQGSSELNIIVGVRNRYFEAAIRAIYDVFIPQK